MAQTLAALSLMMIVSTRTHHCAEMTVELAYKYVLALDQTKQQTNWLFLDIPAGRLFHAVGPSMAKFFDMLTRKIVTSVFEKKLRLHTV